MINLPPKMLCLKPNRMCTLFTVAALATAFTAQAVDGTAPMVPADLVFDEVVQQEGRVLGDRHGSRPSVGQVVRAVRLLGPLLEPQVVEARLRRHVVDQQPIRVEELAPRILVLPVPQPA